MKLSFFPLLSCLAACSIPPSDATITIEAPSDSIGDGGQWEPVANYLDHRCGDLDCHGDPQRNLIVYGCYGLRLDPGYVPGCDLGPHNATTPAEYNATYRSLVGLEPVTMSEVVANGGQDPELLTFVRKATGQENHKGGTLIVIGTDAGSIQDECITSWLAGATNAAACTQALEITQ
jgi:hypothetical protein